MLLGLTKCVVSGSIVCSGIVAAKVAIDNCKHDITEMSSKEEKSFKKTLKNVGSFVCDAAGVFAGCTTCLLGLVLSTSTVKVTDNN